MYGGTPPIACATNVVVDREFRGLSGVALVTIIGVFARTGELCALFIVRLLQAIIPLGRVMEA